MGILSTFIFGPSGKSSKGGSRSGRSHGGHKSHGSRHGHGNRSRGGKSQGGGRHREHSTSRGPVPLEPLSIHGGRVPGGNSRGDRSHDPTYVTIAPGGSRRHDLPRPNDGGRSHSGRHSGPSLNDPFFGLPPLSIHGGAPTPYTPYEPPATHEDTAYGTPHGIPSPDLTPLSIPGGQIPLGTASGTNPYPARIRPYGGYFHVSGSPKETCKHRPLRLENGQMRGWRFQSHYIHDIVSSVVEYLDQPQHLWSHSRQSAYADLDTLWTYDATLDLENHAYDEWWPAVEVADRYFLFFDKFLFDGLLTGEKWVRLDIDHEHLVLEVDNCWAHTGFDSRKGEPYVEIKVSNMSDDRHMSTNVRRRRAMVLATLIHEMIHALLWIYSCNGRRCGTLKQVIAGEGCQGHGPCWEAIHRKVQGVVDNLPFFPGYVPPMGRVDHFAMEVSLRCERKEALETWQRHRPGQPFPLTHRQSGRR
ncbi:MAG: hypothetical protein MMC23_001745 [Stictis urceolatum]|nr:hypothetical protein [Stictis urceolata]